MPVIQELHTPRLIQQAIDLPQAEERRRIKQNAEYFFIERSLPEVRSRIANLIRTFVHDPIELDPDADIPPRPTPSQHTRKEMDEYDYSSGVVFGFPTDSGLWEVKLAAAGHPGPDGSRGIWSQRPRLRMTVQGLPDTFDINDLDQFKAVSTDLDVPDPRKWFGTTRPRSERKVTKQEVKDILETLDSIEAGVDMGIVTVQPFGPRNYRRTRTWAEMK